MKYLISFVKWYFEDFWSIMAWGLSVAFFVGLLQALIVYPVQVIATIVIGGFALMSWNFFLGK